MVKEGNMCQEEQNHKSTNHFCTQIANNTDIQPNIFQNPVLIFLNEQFKAHCVHCYKEKLDRAFFSWIKNNNNLTKQI